jgi:hypothetical protein
LAASADRLARVLLSQGMRDRIPPDNPDEPENPMSAKTVTLLDANRVAKLKTPYATRRVPAAAMATLLTESTAPKAGDLVLCCVEKLGQHRNLELASGRRARLFPGDEIVLAYGNRYAPDQFEAEVPGDLGPCHMVAAGGIAARVITRHGKMKPATQVRPLGLLGDRTGRVINLADFAIEKAHFDYNRVHTVAVVGTSMNAGKTETCTNIIRGLVNAGLRVGAAKVTGTGAGCDAWSMLDAGASIVLDFGDAGMPSTYLASAQEVEDVFVALTRHLYRSGVDVVVLEVADGIFQRETAMLLDSPRFARTVDGIVFAAGDAMGSAAGIQWLQGRGLPVVAASGLLTASPLAIREARAAHGLPVLGLDDLSGAGIAEVLQVRDATEAEALAV